MKLSPKQESVITALSNDHLTSTQILDKAGKIPHILKLYSVLDELRSVGLVCSYMKEGVKYHHAA